MICSQGVKYEQNNVQIEFTLCSSWTSQHMNILLFNFCSYCVHNVQDMCCAMVLLSSSYVLIEQHVNILFVHILFMLCSPWTKYEQCNVHIEFIFCSYWTTCEHDCVHIFFKCAHHGQNMGSAMLILGSYFVHLGQHMNRFFVCILFISLSYYVHLEQHMNIHIA